SKSVTANDRLSSAQSIPDTPGKIVKMPASTGVEHVRLVAAPTVLTANELIQRVPSVLITGRRNVIRRRTGNDLAPEETLQIRSGGLLPGSPRLAVRQHATGDI